MMKPAFEFGHLSLVPRTPEPENQRADKSPISEYFDGWLRSIPAGTQESRTENKRKRPPQGIRPLVTTDVIRVARLTVRESEEHCYWPPDVVQKFLAADVITRKQLG